jgi:hypothetical protein
MDYRRAFGGHASRVLLFLKFLSASLPTMPGGRRYLPQCWGDPDSTTERAIVAVRELSPFSADAVTAAGLHAISG